MKEIQIFLNSLRLKNYSLNTIKTYEGDLKAFTAFLSSRGHLDMASTPKVDVCGYISTLTDMTASTVARKISSIKTFCLFLYVQGMTKENLGDKLEAPKLEKKKPDIIGDDDKRKVLAIAEENKNRNHKSHRDYVIVALLFSTGIRRGELVQIKLEDINHDENRILIHGKGNKERYVFFSDKMKAILKEYIETSRKYLMTGKNDFLFTAKKSNGNAMMLCNVNTIVNDIMEQAHCKKDGRSVHATRKKFATDTYNATGDIYAVAEILGHASIETTKVYAEAGQARLRAVCDAVSI